MWDRRPDLVHFHHLTRLSTTLIDICADLGLPTVLTLHDYWMVCLRGKRLHPVTGEVCDVLDRDRCVQCLHPLWPTLLPNPGDIGDPDDPLDAGAGRYTLERWEAHSKRVMNRVDLVICPASFHRDRFVEWGLDPERCVVIEHGLVTEPLLAPPRGTKPVRTIGFIGNVIRSKGAHVLVDAFNRLDRPELRLELHGQCEADHGITDYAAQLTARPGLELELCGPYEHDDLPRILAGLDVLVVPSIWWETFCLTAREGALAGLPVVASNIAGIRDAVDSGMVLGFEPGDAEDLARVLAEVLDDETLRDRMSRQAGLVRDISECAAETEHQYEAMLERTARAART
jgi:glycosyltransferase involved in cell wall biosynthesis